MNSKTCLPYTDDNIPMLRGLQLYNFVQFCKIVYKFVQFCTMLYLSSVHACRIVRVRDNTLALLERDGHTLQREPCLLLKRDKNTCITLRLHTFKIFHPTSYFCKYYFHYFVTQRQFLYPLH